MNFKLWSSLLGLVVLDACAHTPKPLLGCNLPKARLTIADHAGSLERTMLAPPSEFDQLLLGSLPPPGWKSTSLVDDKPRFLFLSGGSQEGAFGAGMLDEWRIKANGLPKFNTVTGISTGALLGVTAFIGHTDRTIASYSLGSEADIIDVRARSLIGIARKGAGATFVPLRKWISDLLDSTPGNGDGALIGEIAEAEKPGTAAFPAGRKFLVGVTDLRGGEAYAVNMTELAKRWQEATDTKADKAKTRVKQCFIETLVASSSVPGLVPPVYIDNTMYVDGGVRFGIFSDSEVEAMAQVKHKAPSAVAYRIVNYRWSPGVQCTSIGASVATPGQPCLDGPLRDWTIVETGERTIALLVNSVYRFSVMSAGGPGYPKAAIIDDGASSWRLTMNDPPSTVPATRTCAEWRARDNLDSPKPIEFHKREMLCLIGYGRHAMDGLDWWKN